MCTVKPPQKDVLVGVGCFVLYRDPVNNQLYILVGERKGSHGAGTFQLPGGHLEMFEDFATCAQREILEETNITLDKSCIEFITATNNIMWEEKKHYVTIFVKCQIDAAEKSKVKVMEPHKLNGEWKWVTIEELKIMKPLFSPLQRFIDHESLAFLV